MYTDGRMDKENLYTHWNIIQPQKEWSINICCQMDATGCHILICTSLKIKLNLKKNVGYCGLGKFGKKWIEE